MKSVPEIPPNPVNEDGKNEKDANNVAGAVASKQTEKVETPTEKTTPRLPPSKVEVNIESVSALGGTHAYTDVLHAQLLSLEKAKKVEKLPRILIKVAEGDEVTVEVIVIVSFADTSDKLIHSGNFILQAVDTTTLTEVKKGISKVLDIRYEHMSIACGSRFLSDYRSLCYYAIFNGETIHLLVDTPDEVFKNVFQGLLDLGHHEATAAIATRDFIGKMTTKYDLDQGDNPILTQDLLMYELGQFSVPNGYDSDSCDSSDEDNSDEYPSSFSNFGEVELMMQKKIFAASNKIINENQIIENLHGNNVYDEEDSENDNAYLHYGEKNTVDEDFSDVEESDSDSDSDSDSYSDSSHSASDCL